MHNPWSEETDRRVWAMVGTICKGCTNRCGDLEACPMLRARWFGDSVGVNAVPENPAPIKIKPPTSHQPSLF